MPLQASTCVVCFVPLANVASPGPESEWKATTKGLGYRGMHKIGSIYAINILCLEISNTGQGA